MSQYLGFFERKQQSMPDVMFELRGSEVRGKMVARSAVEMLKFVKQLFDLQDYDVRCEANY